MKVLRICTLLLLAAGFPTRAAMAIAPVTATTGPVADAMVTTGPSDGPLNDWNYGGGGAISVSGANATRAGVTPAQRGTDEGYLRFSVAAAQSTFNAAYGAGNWSVKSVSLQVWQTPPNNAIFNDQASGTLSINWTPTDTWVEGTGTPMLPTQNGITFNTRPTATEESEGTAFSYVNPTTSPTFSLSVGSALQNDIKTDSLTSLRIFATDEAHSSMSFTFNSRSFMMPSNRPVLTITAVLTALGDMNGDGGTNNFDISPFELALADPSTYQANFPTVTNWRDRGDINGDNSFDNFDISPFEQMLASGSGSSVPVPEPGTAGLLIAGLAAGVLARGVRRRKGV